MVRTFSSRDLRNALSSFATGVTVVTAIHPGGEPIGITANSFSSVSLEPPLISWCLNKSSASLEGFTPGAPFAVHILANGQRDLALHFARSGRPKFDIDPLWRLDPAPPTLAGVLCRLDCHVYATYPGGDHEIIVGEVRALEHGGGLPLAFNGGRFGHFVVDPGLPPVDVWDHLHGEWL